MFEFEIVISFPGGKSDEAAVLDALFEAGLDDTIVGTGRPDVIALGFTRNGPNLEQVVTAAVAQIMATFPSASVQVLDLAVLGEVKGKAETIRRVRAAAARKATRSTFATMHDRDIYRL